MGKVIDLGTMIKEPLVFNNAPDGKDYIIPGGIPTEFVIEIQKLYSDITDELTEEESMNKLFDILTIILALDVEKKVDKAYVKKHFNNIRLINVIIDSAMQHINDLNNDLN